MKAFYLQVISCLFAVYSFAQGSQTVIDVKISQYNFFYKAWLHLPNDYAANPTKRYPVLFFFHGMGEAGTNINTLLNNGVPYWIKQGSNMEFTNPADGQLYKFICVSIQHPSYSCNKTNIKHALEDIKSKYRVDTSRIYLTGLSAGGWSVTTYTTDTQENANQIAAVVPMSAAMQDVIFTNYKYYANTSLRAWFLCGNTDYSYMANTREAIDTINKYKTGLTKLTAYSGGHCCWNTYYNPAYRENGMNIYEWMLQFTNNRSPIAEAGSDVIAHVPVATANVNGTASIDPDGAITAYQWKQVAGPATLTINNATQPIALVNNVIPGTYSLELEVTDNEGKKSKDYMTIINDYGILSSSAIDLAGIASGQLVFLKWTVKGISNGGEFTIERGGDRLNFIAIGNLTAQQNADPAHQYFFTDHQPLNSTAYYRLKVKANTGEISYSDIITVKPRKNEGAITVFPNPATGDYLNLHIKGYANGTDLTVVVYNASSQQVAAAVKKQVTGIISIETKLLLPGTYIITVMNKNELAGTATFVK
jgi:dienelactone hydrolase